MSMSRVVHYNNAKLDLEKDKFSMCNIVLFRNNKKKTAKCNFFVYIVRH